LTAPERLGDLLRVVDALQPDAAELQLIAELLPDHRRGPHAEGRAPRPALDATDDADEIGTRSAGPPRRARMERLRRTARPGRTGAGRWLPPLEAADRNWWLSVAGLALLASALLVTGRFGLLPWLVVVLALAGARPLARLAERGWSAWWHSPQRHSSVAHESLQDGAPGRSRLDTGEVSLTRARWQPPTPGAPLVPSRQQRTVATLLAGRWVAGEIDLPATVREVASRRPLAVVPQRPRWSTNQGMQLHVDVGPALEPFRHDIDQLRRSLVAVASPHAVVELGFHGDPGVITWPRRLVGPHRGLALAERLPPAGTPVLVVTDLGIAVPRSGLPPEPEDFLEHHRLLGQAGCSVHYLVPYPPERWAPALQALPALYWADGLGATDVLAGIRRRARTA
jgi:hypothetical protein